MTFVIFFFNNSMSTMMSSQLIFEPSTFFYGDDYNLDIDENNENKVTNAVQCIVLMCANYLLYPMRR